MESSNLSTAWSAQQIEDFCRDSSISAVLTPWQLEGFCRMFGLTPPDLQANFDGWCKHVLMSEDLVFLFPRNPGFAKDVNRELSFYEQFAHSGSLVLPRLIGRVRDRDISYYEFGAVTRLKGTPFDRFLGSVSLDRMERVLCSLAEVIAVWHSIEPEQLPAFLSEPSMPEPKRITIGNWHKMVLCPASTKEAADFVYRFIRRLSTGHPLPRMISQEADTKARWTTALTELAELPHVLVHGDLHESHILVEQPDLRITGIIDWQTARIDNPVWDFNFGEWGMGICAWWDHLPALRRSMWRRYLAERRIHVSNPEGLNLFYALWDMIWMVHKRRNGEHPMPTGVGFADSVQVYLRRLDDVTASLCATVHSPDR